jgi:hypothetical protein
LATYPEARVRFPALPEKKGVSLKQGPLSFVSTTEELLDRKVAAPVYKTENTAVGIRHADHVTPSIRKMLAITLPTSGGRSVRISFLVLRWNYLFLIIALVILLEAVKSLF